MPEPQFFETVTKSYEDVKVTDEGVDTADFCEASENLVRIFGLFGNPAFAVVQNDLTGNISAKGKLKKTRAYLAANPKDADTLEKLLAHDKATHPNGRDRQTTSSLMWLCRGLKFTSMGLRFNLTNKSEELSVSFTKAYEQTLKKYHGMMVRPIFYLAMKACPYRANFYPKIGEPPEVVMPKLEAWLSALEELVKREEGVFKDGGYGEV